jgi:hypothetical protein
VAVAGDALHCRHWKVACGVSFRDPFRYPVATALMISASLAQIGEFSFILAELGVALNLLPNEGRDLILAGAIISIMLNPLIFAAVDKLERRRMSPAATVATEPISVTRLNRSCDSRRVRQSWKHHRGCLGAKASTVFCN